MECAEAFWGAVKFRPIPSPGGKVAPKGSEEECGRKPDNQYPVTDLHAGWMRDETREQVFGFVVIEPHRPHSSSVMEIAFGDFHDSFPPGEAILRRVAAAGDS